MSAARLKAALFAAALGLIDLVDGKASAPVIVRLERGKSRLVFEADNSELPQDNSGQLAAAFFGDLERRAVLALNGEPLQAKQIATKLGMPAPSTQLKLTLSALTERGVLLRSHDGYAVASPIFTTIAAGN